MICAGVLLCFVANYTGDSPVISCHLKCFYKSIIKLELFILLKLHYRGLVLERQSLQRMIDYC